ncbi:DegV family protein [Lactobacillus sp. M0403]|uniref:DegV family protein n=1 Tax=Lactobacillus TaxID=1578 RepID=UPI0008154344|nr:MULTISPECIES: DegV family protein [Lactobacillus]MBC6360889.1 DegV family protein [Lactobacillus apis]MBH9985384.1 DegV family protein [Lactobacillus sp. M0390]MBI0092935.1 DegV family protein [Lactobacillus sp. M0403]MCO6529986.1 DegV family protein [Lactobacillus sp.]MCT6876895.1 DegV family protein [Lactobacillus apis]
MSRIKILTDSSAQLTPEEIEKYDITVVPLSVTVGGNTYLDGIEISRQEFVKKMSESAELPKTSQPSIGRLVDTINDLTSDGSEVIGIFLAKVLSGTIDAARQAVKLTGKSDQVHIVDSELTDRAEGLQVLEAARDAEKGKSISEIIDHLEKIKKTQRLRLMIVNLENVIKGGRLGPISGKIANMLNIRIELQMPNGELKVAKKGRGKKFMMAFDQRVLDDIEANKEKIKEVGISYVSLDGVPQKLLDFAQKIKDINSKIDVLVRETSPIIATHAGMDAYAILYYTE